MKKYILLILIILVKFSFAQKEDSVVYRGIFMNSKDYKDNKLSYSINCDSSSGKIRLNHFFSRNYIDLIWGEKNIQLNKDSIFGYRDCKLNDYRFYKNYNHEYRIVENKNVVVYIADMPVPTADGKRTQLVAHYFFSKNLQSEILPLTVINLKKTFPDNYKFHDLLDIEFYGVKDFSAYDDVHKMYKVNFLVGQSITN